MSACGVVCCQFSAGSGGAPAGHRLPGGGGGGGGRGRILARVASSPRRWGYCSMLGYIVGCGDVGETVDWNGACVEIRVGYIVGCRDVGVKVGIGDGMEVGRPGTATDVEGVGALIGKNAGGPTKFLDK